jgi:hypothetical protein
MVDLGKDGDNNKNKKFSAHDIVSGESSPIAATYTSFFSDLGSIL